MLREFIIWADTVGVIGLWVLTLVIATALMAANRLFRG